VAEQTKLNHPWLVAVWPGMGQVALNAGYYLLAKLGMHAFAEFEAQNLFDVDAVAVKNGIIQRGEFPRNRFFVWKDPVGKHDLVVFIGEAQPPIGKYLFCRQLVELAKQLGIERIFTFAAMATMMHPRQASRVFAAATDARQLEEMKRMELQFLEDGNIGGLNGVLLGAAAEAGLAGTCLLGEIPQVFAQIPYPKASLAILEVFSTMSGIAVDLNELHEQVENMQEQLDDLVKQIEKNFGPQNGDDGEIYEAEAEVEEEKGLKPTQRDQIEDLFTQAEKDRTKAFELKQALDRLGAFKEYEDRFLDLFRKPGASESNAPAR
jgi:proteasome assembly chaperone (PAC2) family protein